MLTVMLLYTCAARKDINKNEKENKVNEEADYDYGA